MTYFRLKNVRHFYFRYVMSTLIVILLCHFFTGQIPSNNTCRQNLLIMLYFNDNFQVIILIELLGTNEIIICLNND